jgi:hypothetical protein
MDDDFGLRVVEEPRHTRLGREVVVATTRNKWLGKAAGLHRSEHGAAKKSSAAGDYDAPLRQGIFGTISCHQKGYRLTNDLP